jgi:hypothetical protein
MNDDYYRPNSEPGDPRGAGLRAGDDALRERFAALRREEERRAPEFASLWPGRVRAQRGKTRWLVAAACALTVVAAVLWLRSILHKPADVSVASLAEWKAPTDFLLETPGRELLRTVPEIGEWRGYTVALPGTRPAPARKKVLH